MTFYSAVIQQDENFGHTRIVFKLQVKVIYMSEFGLLKFHGPVNLKFKSNGKK